MKKINKYIIALTLLLVFISTTTSRIFADGKVTYEGQSDGFIFEPGSNNSPTDLFENFKDVMPGDELNESIEIRNNSRDRNKVKIYMKANAANSDSKDFLAQLNLIVKQGNNELYNSTADKTATLTDWVLIGEFAYGDKKVLDVTLKVPIEMSDDYQDAVGNIDWSFKVEEDVDHNIPKTGTIINSPIIIYSLALALVMVIMTYVYKKKIKTIK